jgi:hypothetical protein
MMMSIDMRNTQHLARLQFLLIHWFDLTGFLDVILHGFMVQIIYTTDFRVKRLNILTFRVRLFNRLTRKTVI